MVYPYRTSWQDDKNLYQRLWLGIYPLYLASSVCYSQLTMTKIATKTELILMDLELMDVEQREPARRITISATLHQSGLYGRVARSHSWVKGKRQPTWSFPKGIETIQIMSETSSGLMRQKFNSPGRYSNTVPDKKQWLIKGRMHVVEYIINGKTWGLFHKN